MAITTPNKETVRRVCLLSGATCCYILVDTGDEYVDVLADIKKEEIKHCVKSLHDWGGMKFRLYSLLDISPDEIKLTNKIKSVGEKIYP